MTHLKRQAVPKNWPIHRKGTTFVVSPLFARTKGIPILILLRDMLKIAETRKEVKKAMNENAILLNGKPVKEEKNSAMLFDTLNIVPSKKNYRVSLDKLGKFTLEEIKENEAHKKIAKVINKKVLNGKKTQLNLSDGRNFISEIKCSVNDSAIIDLKNKKIENCLPFKESSNVISIGGKHAGRKGKIIKIKNERKMAEVDFGNNKIDVLIKQLMVIE